MNITIIWFSMLCAIYGNYTFTADDDPFALHWRNNSRGYDNFDMKWMQFIQTIGITNGMKTLKQGDSKSLRKMRKWVFHLEAEEKPSRTRAITFDTSKIRWHSCPPLSWPSRYSRSARHSWHSRHSRYSWHPQHSQYARYYWSSWSGRYPWHP